MEIVNISFSCNCPIQCNKKNQMIKESTDDVSIRNGITSRLDRPVVMIGLMGAGKSRIGRLLADDLGLEFIDSDREIEIAAGCSIPEIFERYGEAAFREAEHKTIARLLEGGPLVLATGGGAVMNPQTAALVWDKSISIWLRAEIGVLVKRTAGNSARPLLNSGNPEDILKKLSELRYPVYEKANLIVDSHDVHYHVTLDAVKWKLYEYLNNQN